MLADVRLGSKADLGPQLHVVRFAPRKQTSGGLASMSAKQHPHSLFSEHDEKTMADDMK